MEPTMLNDGWLCDTNPPDNYLRVAIEDDLPRFVERLLLHEANRFDPRLGLVKGDEGRFEAVGFSRNARLVDDESATQLGQLFALSQATDWQLREEATYRAFWKWAGHFKERNAGR